MYSAQTRQLYADLYKAAEKALSPILAPELAKAAQAEPLIAQALLAGAGGK